MKAFKDTLTYKILTERWGDVKDMEKYFVDRSKEYTNQLKSQINKK